jgi:small subunit ribosomal protein S3
MGQKVHPIGFRLGVNVGNRHVKEWQGKWYADKDYTKFLHEDLRVRQLIMGRLAEAGVSRVDIERSANQMTVTIHAAKPGIVIGKSGVKVEELRRNLEAMTGKRVRVTIQEIRQPELDSYLVARSVADQLERRVAFRRAMKQAVGRAMRFGAKGVRIQVAGRLGGAEMSRREWEREGRVPLHTLRADIDFGQAEARTTYGVIGVKVWIYRGDVAPTARVGGEGFAAAAVAPGTRGGRPTPGGPVGAGPVAAAPARPAAPPAPAAAPAPAAPVAPEAPATPDESPASPAEES